MEVRRGGAWLGEREAAAAAAEEEDVLAISPISFLRRSPAVSPAKAHANDREMREFMRLLGSPWEEESPPAPEPEPAPRRVITTYGSAGGSMLVEDLGPSRRRRERPPPTPERQAAVRRAFEEELAAETDPLTREMLTEILADMDRKAAAAAGGDKKQSTAPPPPPTADAITDFVSRPFPYAYPATRALPPPPPEPVAAPPPPPPPVEATTPSTPPSATELFPFNYNVDERIPGNIGDLVDLDSWFAEEDRIFSDDDNDVDDADSLFLPMEDVWYDEKPATTTAPSTPLTPRPFGRPRIQPGARCSRQGCHERVKHANLCHAHYNELRRNRAHSQSGAQCKEMLRTVLNGVEVQRRCPNKVQNAGGLCRTHHRHATAQQPLKRQQKPRNFDRAFL